MLTYLQRHFLTGLLAITPLAITTWILWRLYDLLSATMRPWLRRVPGLNETYPEFVLTLIGLVIFVLLIVLIGIFTRNLIGMALFRLVERFFQRIPVVKSVFSATKQIAEVFLRDRRTAFQKVVVFEYPRKGLFSLGFVTMDRPTDPLVNVFLPTTPNPTSGYMLLVPRKELRELPLPVEEAIKLIVSGGSIMTDFQGQAVATQAADLAPGALPAASSGEPASGPEPNGKDPAS